MIWNHPRDLPPSKFTFLGAMNPINQIARKETYAIRPLLILLLSTFVMYKYTHRCTHPSHRVIILRAQYRCGDGTKWLRGDEVDFSYVARFSNM